MLLVDLPGPRDFLQAIESSIQNGRNVAIYLPEHPRLALENHIRRALYETWNWVTLNPISDERPAERLAREFSLDFPHSQLPSPRSLVNHPDFSGNVIWVEGWSATSWNHWQVFMEEYADACRMIPERRRSLFLLVFHGPPPKPMLSGDVCLDQHQWSSVPAPWDILCYAAGLIPAGGRSEAQRHLLASIITQIAMWDFETAERLSRSTISTILSPVQILREIALERNWQPDEIPCVYRGTAGRFENATHTHAALLALKGEERDIQSRIWQGQVQVLLPLIERRRLNLLPKLERYLHFPLQIGNQEVSDIRELEIGQLYYLLHNKIPPNLWREIATLRRQRNDLAHLQPLSIHEIESF